MKNLIIGVIKNYNFRDVKPFVSTLMKTGYKGEVVFFCNNVSIESQDKLRKHGVTCINFGISYPYVEKQYSADIGILPKSFSKQLHLFSLRQILYYLYLNNCGKKYENIMLTDVRDVIFQKDPFDFIINGNLCCTLESEDWPISKSSFNATEIETVFGVEAYEKIKANLISNCGVTIGPSVLIMKYLEKMIDLILSGGGSTITDQGIHNYIMWNGMIPNIKFLKNNEGPVLTLGYEKIVHRNKDKKIVDNKGNIINIIHQYDRHFNVAKDYYDWKLKIKYAILIIKNRYIKRINDSLSIKVKKVSPRTHASIKKIKHLFHLD